MPRASGARLGASSRFVGCLLKKLILIALLFFLAAPVVYAYDFGTAGTIAALGTAGAALALIFGAPAALGTVAIGALVAGIQFATDPAANQTGEVEVQLSPSARLATPPGWTSPTSGTVEPSPPSSSTPLQQFKGIFSGSSWQPTLQAACETHAAYLRGLYPSDGNNCRSISSDLSNPWYTIGNSINQGYTTYTANSQIGCNAGYMYNGTSCVLSDPNSVMKPSDDRCTIKRTGNSFSVDPRDPDCVSGRIPATTSISPNVITLSKSDGSTKSVTINADGSSTITESRPNNSTNTTETNTTTISAPNASGAVSVTGQGSGVAPGTGTQAGSSAPAVNVNFDKSGLATEGTLGGIKSSVDAIKDGLDPGSADSSLSAQRSAFDTAMDGLTSMFSAEPGKAATGLADDFSLGGFLPAQCGCTPLTINFKGHQASFDWCSPMATFKDVLEWVIGLLTAVYVLSLFRIGGSK